MQSNIISEQIDRSFASSNGKTTAIAHIPALIVFKDVEKAIVGVCSHHDNEQTIT